VVVVDESNFTVATSPPGSVRKSHMLARRDYLHQLQSITTTDFHKTEGISVRYEQYLITSLNRYSVATSRGYPTLTCGQVAVGNAVVYTKQAA
jgi:hypothetical protein